MALCSKIDKFDFDPIDGGPRDGEDQAAMHFIASSTDHMGCTVLH
jgi:hypothetical protein